jgi:hypothetical protein
MVIGCHVVHAACRACRGGFGVVTAEGVSLERGFSRAKLSRVELGDIPIPKLGDLEKLMDKYGVTDPDDREALLTMQRESLSREPFTSYRKLMPSGTPMFLGLERDAYKIRAYENFVVHGFSRPRLTRTPRGRQPRSSRSGQRTLCRAMSAFAWSARRIESERTARRFTSS